MTWFGWLYIGLTIVGMLGTVWQIDRKRDPITPSVALVQLVISGLLMWGAVVVGTKAW